MATPSCSDVALSNPLKPDGNSYAYCLAAEIRALKSKNLQTRDIAEGGTSSNSAQGAINNLTQVSSAISGQVLTKVGSDATWSTPSGAGIGDVSGPIGAGNGNIAVFDGVTGKLIGDSGKSTVGLVDTNTLQYLNNKKLQGGCEYQGTAIDEIYGGTGQYTYTKGDILYSDAVNNLARLPIGSTGKVLAVSATGVPEWITNSGGGGSLSAPYYVDQPAVGSNISYYDAQSPVATYPHNAYQNVLRVQRGATDYTGTPTTYLHLGELDANTVAYKTYAGYQQNLSTDTGGRTMSAAYRARVEHNAMGDVNGFFATVSVNGHSNMAGISGNWTGAPSGTVCGGEVYANTAKTNLYGQEFQLYSNGQDNTTAFGAVYGLYRDNTVASYNNVWVGVRAQSNGTSYSDIGFQVANNFKVGFDATSMAMDANKAAFTMSSGGRFYMGCPVTAWPSMVPTLTGAYLDTDNTKIRGSVPFGVIASQAHILKLEAGDTALSEVDASSGAVKINVNGNLRYIPYAATPTGVGGGSGTIGNLLSVLDYGALGNGIANDTTAIQNCINDCFATGKNMLVPAGTYLVTGLTLNNSSYANHFSIFGEGRNKTVIKKYTTSSTPVVTIGATSTIFQANITVEGITFHGLNSTTASTVKVYDLARSSFKDCIFYSGATTFELVGAVAAQFYNCMFDSAQIGMKLTWVAGLNSTPNETLLNGCQLVNNTSWGLYLEHGSLCVLDSCEIENNGTTANSSTGGIYATNLDSTNASLTNVAGIIAQNCWCEDNKGRASFVFNDGRNTVENCHFINNPNSINDIYVSGGTYKVANATFMNAKTYNIQETSSIAIGSSVSELSGSGFTPTIAFAANNKTVLDFGGIQSGYNASASDGTATITFARPYPTGTQPVVIATIIANTTTSITTAEIHTITNTGFSIRTKAYTGNGGAVVSATKEFFWMAGHQR